MNKETEMITNMQSICKDCKHISVDFDIKRFFCKKLDSVVMGILLNCNSIEKV